jgi:hypothetical protein
VEGKVSLDQTRMLHATLIAKLLILKQSILVLLPNVVIRYKAKITHFLFPEFAIHVGFVFQGKRGQFIEESSVIELRGKSLCGIIVVCEAAATVRSSWLAIIGGLTGLIVVN